MVLELVKKEQGSGVSLSLVNFVITTAHFQNTP